MTKFKWDINVKVSLKSWNENSKKHLLNNELNQCFFEILNRPLNESRKIVKKKSKTLKLNILVIFIRQKWSFFCYICQDKFKYDYQEQKTVYRVSFWNFSKTQFSKLKIPKHKYLLFFKRFCNRKYVFRD